MTKKNVDNHGELTDKSRYWKEDIGEIKIQLPINRNISLRLFGQLKNLIDRRI
jgi:hypothetical protein